VGKKKKIGGFEGDSIDIPKEGLNLDRYFTRATQGKREGKERYATIQGFLWGEKEGTRGGGGGKNLTKPEKTPIILREPTGKGRGKNNFG